MLNRFGLAFAILLISSPAWAQSGTRNAIPAPSGGSGTRNAVPNSNLSPSFSTPQPPFSQLPSESPPYSPPGFTQSRPSGQCGCSASQPLYSPYRYSPQPSLNARPFYSSRFSGSGCSSQSSIAPRTSYYSGSYYQPRYQPFYRNSYRNSYRGFGW